MMPPNNGPSHPRTEFDHLPITAEGGRVGNLNNEELTARLAALNIEGFNHNAGRLANLAAYAAAHHKIYDAAGKAAVQQWLAGTISATSAYAARGG